MASWVFTCATICSFWFHCLSFYFLIVFPPAFHPAASNPSAIPGTTDVYVSFHSELVFVYPMAMLRGGAPSLSPTACSPLAESYETLFWTPVVLLYILVR